MPIPADKLAKRKTRPPDVLFKLDENTLLDTTLPIPLKKHDPKQRRLKHKHYPARWKPPPPISPSDSLNNPIKFKIVTEIHAIRDKKKQEIEKEVAKIREDIARIRREREEFRKEMELWGAQLAAQVSTVNSTVNAGQEKKVRSLFLGRRICALFQGVRV